MTPPSGDTEHLQALGLRLLEWYEHYRRDFPWRRRNDPYAIWVAEMMLQQTRTDTVLSYYERFLDRFPTLQDLAGASLDQVLKAWEGMGYYARARNLHAAARHVMTCCGGQIPSSVDELLALPGVGRYTAAAVASIAFGQDAIALDGNLRRVLCRLFSVDDDPDRPTTQRRLEAMARAMLPPGRAADFNQGLMDLGATICLPSAPRCMLCPLIELCHARRDGIEDMLPIRTSRSQRPHRDVTAGVIHDGNGHLLISKRPLDAMLGGLWEFPGGKRLPCEDLPLCLRREIQEELGIDIAVGELLCTVDHAFTHLHMTLYVYDCEWVGGSPQPLGCAAWEWVTLDDLDAFAFPVADQKIISFLRSRNT